MTAKAVLKVGVRELDLVQEITMADNFTTWILLSIISMGGILSGIKTVTSDMKDIRKKSEKLTVMKVIDVAYFGVIFIIGGTIGVIIGISKIICLIVTDFPW